MRLMLNSLIALTLAGVCCVALVQYRASQRDKQRVTEVHKSLAQLHKHAVYHQVMGEDGHSPAGFPNEIRLEWFDDTPPINHMVNGQRPWIDVAPPEDFSDQPPDPVVVSDRQAAFWYNPNTGVFRARVQPEITDQRTLETYNEINRTSLASLPAKNDLSRQPLAMRLVPTSSTQHASPQPTAVEQVLDQVDVVEPEPAPAAVELAPADPGPQQRPSLKSREAE